MGYIQFVHDQVGLAFSIVGLTIVVPTLFIFKQYNRFLDHLQVIFLFSIILTPSYQTFGSHLDQSWAKFVPNFLSFCSAGDLVCQSGFALSWTISLVGVIILLYLIVTFQKLKKPELRFQPVYSFFKGFFKWTYLPLVSYSLSYLIMDLKYQTQTNLIASIIILAWVILFPIIQLIVYKVIQQQNENIWIKWFQFLGYTRQFLIVLILVLGKQLQTDTSIAKYFVYGPLVLYSGTYLWKGIFMYRVLERILFGLEEAIMITIFSFYLFDPSHMTEYEIDFIGLSVILFIHLTEITIKIVTWLVYGKIDQPKITPSQNFQEKNRANFSFEVLDMSNDFIPKRKNKYDEPDDLLGSRESLTMSIRKGNQRRRR